MPTADDRQWLLTKESAPRMSLLSQLDEPHARKLASYWPFWARPEQLPPPGDWRVWLVCAGRGFGKTRAGAEWVGMVAHANPHARIALVGSSIGEARAVMVEGETEETDDSLQTQTVKVKYNGDEYEFEVKPHQTILEAALDLNIDLPYSCQAGMCTACMGTCTEGKVKMDEEDGLTEKELKRGVMLTCVAHPITKGVVIEID